MALHGAPPAAAPSTARQLYLEDVGENLISVLNELRNHTGLGLKESKELADSAPCVVAAWDDEDRMNAFRKALIKARAFAERRARFSPRA